jgi:UPF0755 protein
VRRTGIERRDRRSAARQTLGVDDAGGPGPGGPGAADPNGGAPAADPYGGAPDAYGGAPAADPYGGAPAADPYGGAPAADPYGGTAVYPAAGDPGHPNASPAGGYAPDPGVAPASGWGASSATARGGGYGDPVGRPAPTDGYGAGGQAGQSGPAAYEAGPAGYGTGGQAAATGYGEAAPGPGGYGDAAGAAAGYGGRGAGAGGGPVDPGLGGPAGAAASAGGRRTGEHVRNELLDSGPRELSDTGGHLVATSWRGGRLGRGASPDAGPVPGPAGAVAPDVGPGRRGRAGRPAGDAAWSSDPAGGLDRPGTGVPSRGRGPASPSDRPGPASFDPSGGRGSPSDPGGRAGAGGRERDDPWGRLGGPPAGGAPAGPDGGDPWGRLGGPPAGGPATERFAAQRRFPSTGSSPAAASPWGHLDSLPSGSTPAAGDPPGSRRPVAGGAPDGPGGPGAAGRGGSPGTGRVSPAEAARARLLGDRSSGTPDPNATGAHGRPVGRASAGAVGAAGAGAGVAAASHLGARPSGASGVASDPYGRGMGAGPTSDPYGRAGGAPAGPGSDPYGRAVGASAGPGSDPYGGRAAGVDPSASDPYGRAAGGAAAGYDPRATAAMAAAGPGGPGGPPGAGGRPDPTRAAPGPAAARTTAAGVSYGARRPDDDEYDDYDDDLDDLDEAPPRRRGRTLLALLVVFAILAGVAFTGWSWLQGKIDPSGPPGEVVAVEIPEGTSTSQIGSILADAGVISDASVWTWYTRLKAPGSIQAGDYEVPTNSSFDEAINVLEAGPAAPPGRMVTVPEGYTVAQMVARVTDPEDGIEGFTPEAVEAALAATRSDYLPAEQSSLEGMLFPETYRLEDGEDEAALVTRMVTQFDGVMTELGAIARGQALGRSPYELVIVASMVEEEAQVPEERAQVARVIYNRLERDMPLQIDATSCYEKTETPCRLTRSDLDSDSPYNTRNDPGLPPTPIASPGRASLEAAMNPAEGDWIYYVRSDDAGHHVFTASDEEFNAARQECIENGWGCG